MQLYGIHHLTAITANARGNHAFYTGVLGMRLVKKTVNQDDVSAYHLFYADGKGSPGTDLTFFDWPAVPERRGTHSIVGTGLRVGGEAALQWWLERCENRHVRHRGIVERDGRLTFDFEDPEGQRLSLIDDGASGEAHPSGKEPGASRAPNPRPWTDHDQHSEARTYRIAFFKTSSTCALRGNTKQMAGPLCTSMKWARAGPLQNCTSRSSRGCHPPGREPGGVHHVALRTTLNDYNAWVDRLAQARVASSGPVDRYYFRSLYFREPNGILFEIATDGPGFTADESLEMLGERLSLPPFLEHRRREIESALKPLN